MWPFKRTPDTRPATIAAQAVAKSLTKEASRWSLCKNYYSRLVHDSGITVGTDGFIYDPDLDDEPDANGELVKAAIDEWVAARLAMPAPEPLTEPAQAG